MCLKNGSILYVRIDCKVFEKEMTQQDFRDHLTYVKNIAKDRYFLGGGFGNTDGGMILFEAESLEEAHKIAHNDPIIERGLYQCEIYKWELAVLSADIN